MLKNSNGTLIYLNVPDKYEYIYKELLNKLIGFGEDIIGDCSCDCKRPSKHINDCWLIFQSACASYTIGETKIADFMINHITAQLNINYRKVMCNPNYVYYGHTNISPNVFKDMSIEDIFNLPETYFKDLVIDDKEFIIKQSKSIHYVLVPAKYIELVSAEYGKGVVTKLWDKDNILDGAYSTSHKGGLYNDTFYNVYFYYSPIGSIPDDIRIVVDNK